MASVSDHWCFLCGEKVVPSYKRIKIFGKSSVDMTSLILHAINVDLSVYSEKENLVICGSKCYKRLLKYQRALRKVEKLRGEIERDFRGGFGPAHRKRLSVEPGRDLGANKSVKLQDEENASVGRFGSCSNQSRQHQVKVVIASSCNVNSTPILPTETPTEACVNSGKDPSVRSCWSQSQQLQVKAVPSSRCKVNSTPILQVPTEVCVTVFAKPV